MQGSKRSRPGMTDSFSQDAYNSGITGVGNDQIGSSWDWDDDDRNMGMDIQSLLSEFGDFGDFFENDALPFGEVILFVSLHVELSEILFHFLHIYCLDFIT